MNDEEKLSSLPYADDTSKENIPQQKSQRPTLSLQQEQELEDAVVAFIPSILDAVQGEDDLLGLETSKPTNEVQGGDSLGVVRDTTGSDGVDGVGGYVIYLNQCDLLISLPTNNLHSMYRYTST